MATVFYSSHFCVAEKNLCSSVSIRVIRVPLYSSTQSNRDTELHRVHSRLPTNVLPTHLCISRSKMKLHIRVIRNLRIQKPLTLRQVHHVAIFILRHIRLLKPKKLHQLLRVFARQPASFIKRQTIKHHRCPILMQQAVLNHFKLQLTHTTDYFFIATKLGKQLRHSFICQLHSNLFPVASSSSGLYSPLL